MMVVNTHTKNLPGEHWIAIYVDKDRNGELFDSLSSPINTTLMRWLNRFTRKWLTNTVPFQNPLAATCGSYVIYYVMKRLSFKNYLMFQSLFNSKLYENDRIVTKFYNALKK